MGVGRDSQNWYGNCKKCGDDLFVTVNHDCPIPTEINTKVTKIICGSDLARRKILYNDTIGGKQCMRDDMWAVTTLELNENDALIAQYAVELHRVQTELEFLKKAISEIRLPPSPSEFSNP